MTKRHPLFIPVIFVGGLLFGFGLGFSHMAQPEVVLSFLQLDDFGLLFVMGAAALVAGIAFRVGTTRWRKAPLTGTLYALRTEALDKNILIGGAIFGVGWGLSGICPGAAFASVGIGNYPIFIGIAGMFAGAYLYGTWQSSRGSAADQISTAPKPHEGCG